MSETVTTKLPQMLVKKIRTLIDLGEFSSKSEFVRYCVRAELEKRGLIKVLILSLLFLPGAVHAETLVVSVDKTVGDVFSPDAFAAKAYADHRRYAFATTSTNTLDIILDGYDKVIIVGGPVAVSPAVENEIRAAVKEVERIYGATRYETSWELYKKFSDKSRVAFTRGDRKDFAELACFGVPIVYIREDEKPDVDIYRVRFVYVILNPEFNAKFPETLSEPILLKNIDEIEEYFATAGLKKGDWLRETVQIGDGGGGGGGVSEPLGPPQTTLLVELSIIGSYKDSGDTFTAEVKVSNVGSATATGVIALPVFTDKDGGTVNTTWTVLPSQLSFSDIAPGSSEIQNFTITRDATDYTLHAEVSASNAPAVSSEHIPIPVHIFVVIITGIVLAGLVYRRFGRCYTTL